MKTLYTTKEIAKLYEVPTTTITNNWCNKGLKFIRSKNSFLFKQAWVEEYLEKQAEKNANEKTIGTVRMHIEKNVRPNLRRKKFNNEEMKIVWGGEGMSLQEAKEFFGILLFGSYVATLVICGAMYKIAEITYKIQKNQRRNSNEQKHKSNNQNS